MISDSIPSSLKTAAFSPRTIRPIAAAAIHGMAFWDGYLIAIDAITGYIFKINPVNDDTTIINSHYWSECVGARGLAIAGDTLWFTRDEDIYYCSLTEKSKPQHLTRLSYTLEGIAVIQSTLYVTSERSGCIFVLNGQTGREVTRLYAPGVGQENITVKGEELWVSDTIEQTVYCLDRATGRIIFSVLTPFECPTGLAFCTDAETGKEVLYVAYAQDEPYIRDNPNADPNYEIQYRDRTFIHPLYFHYNKAEHYALSNGYLIEMSYVEELSPLEEVVLEDIEWRIALPAETHRQKVRKVESVGHPFSEETQDGQRIAVFKFDKITGKDRILFGWKALLEVWSIKYQLNPRDCERLPELPPDFHSRYLVDDDDLAMETAIIQNAAKEAIARETNLLRQMYSIRNYVYDKLSYGIKPHIDTPDVTLERGVGSCGEYLGVLLALTRLNSIASRTIGRYKCPPQPLLRGVSLQPDYNHVWMEFYLPGFGWLPMESNPDDVVEGGPYPTRFFMGLSWYHAEMAKGVSFEKLTSKGEPVTKENASIGELAINHVRFTILEELSPEPT